VKVYRDGKIVNWLQGRMQCFQCGHNYRSKQLDYCVLCNSWLVLPLPDLQLLPGGGTDKQELPVVGHGKPPGGAA